MPERIVAQAQRPRISPMRRAARDFLLRGLLPNPASDGGGGASASIRAENAAALAGVGFGPRGRRARPADPASLLPRLRPAPRGARRARPGLLARRLRHAGRLSQRARGHASACSAVPGSPSSCRPSNAAAGPSPYTPASPSSRARWPRRTSPRSNAAAPTSTLRCGRLRQRAQRVWHAAGPRSDWAHALARSRGACATWPRYSTRWISARRQDSVDITATYQDPCHLAHAQRIVSAPRRLLARIPGLRLVEMAESALCCGSAGVYGLTQPEMSSRLRRRKVDAVAHGPCGRRGNRESRLRDSGGRGFTRRRQHGKRKHVVELLDDAFREPESV